MSIDLSGFNPNEFDDPADDEVVPTGEYKVVLESAEEKDYSEDFATRGTRMNCKWQVIEGLFKNRIVFDSFGLGITNNPEKRAKANSKLASLFRALGIAGAGSFSELYNRPVVAFVKAIGKSDERKNNYIAKFGPVSGFKSAAIRPPTATAQEGGKIW